MSKKDVKKINWILIIILAIFVVNSVVYMGEKPLWFDEAFSLETVKLINDGQEIDWKKLDVHPPIYYEVVSTWMKVPHGYATETEWARVLSMVFGILFLLFIYGAVKNFFSSKEKALFVTGLMSICSTYVYFAVEARQYMMVMMLSALGVFVLSLMVKKDLDKVSYKIALVVVMLIGFILPLIHYYAGMYFIVMTGMAGVFLWKKGKAKAIRASIMIFLCGMFGVIMALTYAIPQMTQGAFMWFHQSTFTSLPSSLLFMFVQIEGVPMNNWIAQILFIIFCGVMLYLFLWKILLKTVKKGMTEEQKYLTLFMITGLAPFAGLLLKVALSDIFPQLFHHRFFLVVGWMFAVACFVYLAEFYEKGGFVQKGVLVGVFVVLFISLVFGMLNAPFGELRELMDDVPCGGVVVVHQSPFSGLPAKVMDRERGCENKHVFVTFLEPNQRHTAGYDVVPKEDIYYDTELPEGSFFYFLPDSEGEVFYRNGTYVHSFDGNTAREAGIEIKDEDGISLWYFAEDGVKMDVRVDFQ